MTDRRGLRDRATTIVLLLYLVLVMCPIRYFPWEGGVDPTWRIALNIAHARAIHTVFTAGPLGYLMFPMDVGHNLEWALRFQYGLWLVVAGILADLFLRGGFPVRNLALFSACVGMSAPVFWFNGFGVETIMVAAMLMALVMYEAKGGWPRYALALVLAGVLPLFKLTAGLLAAGVLAGFVLEMALRRGIRAIPFGVVTAVVPVAIAVLGLRALLPEQVTLRVWLRGTLEIVGGFTGAMSYDGPMLQLGLAALVIVILLAVLAINLRQGPPRARYLLLVLTVPIALGFRQGFVRQDAHVVNFFCIAALCLAIGLLGLDLKGSRGRLPGLLVALFFCVWLVTVGPDGRREPLRQASGIESGIRILGSLSPEMLKLRLATSRRKFRELSSVEPEVLHRIGDSAVASLSMDYASLAATGGKLAIYPVLQRYSAYTPYLDSLNAAWVRDRGPRFLLYDGKTIDGRDGWAETPQMWLETYRWYDAAVLGRRNLLLSRRAQPRFRRLESIGHARLAFPGELRLPDSPVDVFYSVQCGYSPLGKARNALFRDSPVTLATVDSAGTTHRARVIPRVLVAPMPAWQRPITLRQFAAMFEPGESFTRRFITRIELEPASGRSWTGTCDAQFFHIVR